MGHRQRMTPAKRLEWDIRQYKARLEANRGHNYAYMTRELEEHLARLGYQLHGTYDERGILRLAALQNAHNVRANYAASETKV